MGLLGIARSLKLGRVNAIVESKVCRQPIVQTDSSSSIDRFRRLESGERRAAPIRAQLRAPHLAGSASPARSSTIARSPPRSAPRRACFVTNPIADGREIAYALAMVPSRAAWFLGLASALAAAACSDDGGAPTPDAPQGSCARGEVFFTGELIDWDSTAAAFRGINDAALTVEGEAARTDQTSPNGRFEVCLAGGAAITRVTVDASSASTYLDGVAIAEVEVLAAGATPSFRSFTAMREQRFTPRIELGKAQVFVDVAGAQREVTLPVAYQAALAFDGTSWAAGTTGRAVFFLNVEARTPATTVTMPGSFLGGKSVPLTANQLTFVTLLGK
jgi:hypothetical protein